MEKENEHETKDSEFLHHAPCPSCNSRNNLGVYTDHSYCFGCGWYVKGTVEGKSKTSSNHSRKTRSKLLVEDGKYVATRGLTLETVKKFNYSYSKYNGKGCYIANYCESDGTVVRQKLRFKDKKFTFIGKSKTIPLFGQHLWSGKGKMVVVTEGEIDAMSVSQMQENKWPVVSVGNGAGGAQKNIKMQLQWLEGYDKVILMFDSDKAGREAASKCAKLFSPGKAAIACLPDKDPNALLMGGKGHEIVKAIWNAKSFRPDGIVEGQDTWEILNSEDKTRTIATPWSCINELTHGGFRTSEITMICAGTGIGKSQLCRQFAWNALNNGEKVAYIALEETVKRSVQGILSLEVQAPLHLEHNISEEKIKDAWERTIRDKPIYFYDHWGSADSDNLINKIRFLARGCDVSTVVLDHISIIVSDIEGGDERRIIDNMMTKFASLVIELGIALVIVCHLKKSSGKSFEEGGQISLDDLRGSGSLKQLSWTVVGLERDQQSKKNPNVAGVRILKNRTTGETGLAGYIEYDKNTTLLNEYFPPHEDNEYDYEEGENEDESNESGNDSKF